MLSQMIPEPSRRPKNSPNETAKRRGVDLSRDEQMRLVAAARDKKPVSGLTHNFYRYPARFPPQMVRAVIEAFSQPGDLILDPFAGGGTSLVEALAAGRAGFGSDISTLASFVTMVKTTLLNDQELDEAETWARFATESIRMDRLEPEFPEWAEAGYFRNLGSNRFWRIRKALAQVVATVENCASAEIERFARCIVLRTAQWALDGRRTVPTVEQFRRSLLVACQEMVDGMRSLRHEVGQSCMPIECRNRSAVGLEDDPVFRCRKAKLVITSPPYPGVHVLYHRWQVGGGKETGTPFWIANTLDGSGAAYYTMGDRKAAKLEKYFATIEASLKSVESVCASDAVIVQVIAFAQPDWQLPMYLDACANAGLTELRLPILAEDGDGRLWRTVPNRRWYADRKGETSGSKEVMLFHVKS